MTSLDNACDVINERSLLDFRLFKMMKRNWLRMNHLHVNGGVDNPAGGSKADSLNSTDQVFQVVQNTIIYFNDLDKILARGLVSGSSQFLLITQPGPKRCCLL